MTNITIKYLGKDFSYPLLTADDLIKDKVICLQTYEFRIQGYEHCYNETRRFHFLTTKEELVTLQDSKVTS